VDTSWTVVRTPRRRRTTRLVDAGAEIQRARALARAAVAVVRTWSTMGGRRRRRRPARVSERSFFSCLLHGWIPGR
jgi:hypothetical protein